MNTRTDNHLAIFPIYKMQEEFPAKMQHFNVPDPGTSPSYGYKWIGEYHIILETFVRKQDPKTKKWFLVQFYKEQRFSGNEYDLFLRTSHRDKVIQYFLIEAYHHLILGVYSPALRSATTNELIHYIDENQESEEERIKRILLNV